MIASYLLIAAAIVIVIGGALGRAIFPIVDAGQLALRLSAPAGTRIEETEKLANKTIDIIRAEVGAENIGLTLGFVGVQNAAYPINTNYLWTSSPQEAVLQLQRIETRASILRNWQNGSERGCLKSCQMCTSASSQATSSAG